MGYSVNIANALKGLSEAKAKTMHAVEIYGKAAAAKLEAEAKQNAPWQDQTGNARQTIAGTSGWVGNKYRIGISGNMEYSPYLEFCNEKKYAILWPTVNRLKDEILGGMKGMMR